MDEDIIIRRLDKTEVQVNIYGGRGSRGGNVESVENCPYTVAYVALRNDRIIGALNITRKRRKDQVTVTSRATGVRPTSQRKGLGKALWQAMIKAERPKRIVVNTVSDTGHSMIESLKEQFLNIKWEWHSGKQSLRRNRRG